MVKEETVTAKFENIELANLTHAVVSLTKMDVAKAEADVDYKDADFIDLCKKARRYLNLVLDTAIEKYEKVGEGR